MACSMLHAVLVHKLPVDCIKNALALLPDRHIEKVEHDEVGLRIYFRRYSSARESILRRHVLIQGTPYTICPLETNLTLQDIRKYASKSTIRNLMAPYGSVIDLYPVEVKTKEGNFETKTLTDDYRIILGVPEVQADFKLLPLRLPDLRDYYFRLSFFCRLCRRNGHMQLQCLEYTQFSSQVEQSRENQSCHGGQSECPEVGVPVKPVNRARCPSEQEDEEQVPKEKILMKRDLEKIKKELFVPDHRPCVRTDHNQTAIMNTHATHPSTFESRNKDFDKRHCQREPASRINEVNKKEEDVFERSPVANKMQGVGYVQRDDEYAPHTSIATPNKKYGNDEIGQWGEKPPHNRKPPIPSRQPKRSERNVLSRLIPPDANLKSTKKLLLTIFTTPCVDIPQKVEAKLLKILEWNHRRDERSLKEKDKKFITWLELYLAKVSRKRTHHEDSEGDKEALQPRNSVGEQSSGEVEKKQKSKRKRVVSLSTGIEKIVLKTSGKLAPPLLRNFLNQVRGRKKLTEIATHFTTDFLSLFNQLEDVEKSYYLYGERGTGEDRDIEFIKRVRQKLMLEYTAKEQTCISNRQSGFRKQSRSKKDLSQNTKSTYQKNVDYGSRKGVRLSDPPYKAQRGEYPVKFEKGNLEKHMNNRGQPSRIPRSSTESCTVEYSDEQFQINQERNLSYEEQYHRSRSRKHFSTEEHQKSFQYATVESNLPLKGQPMRILNSRKRSRDDITGKSGMNSTFYNSQSTSNFSDSTDNGSLGNYDWDDSRTFSDRSRYTQQSSVEDDSFENFRSDFQQTSFVGKPATAVSNTGGQTSIAEEFPTITKMNLRQILSNVVQFSQKVSFEGEPRNLPNVKTGVDVSEMLSDETANK